MYRRFETRVVIASDISFPASSMRFDPHVNNRIIRN